MKKRKGVVSGLEQPGDPSLFGEPPPSGDGRKRGSKKQSKGKKAVMTLPTETTNLGSYFFNIDLEVEEPTAEVPLSKEEEEGKAQEKSSL